MNEPENIELLTKFTHLSQLTNSIVAARVSPKQKAIFVKNYKNININDTVLAIGDGANDVNMITSADIGVGISGREGLQATRVSDFAIGEFKLLRNLLMTYGVENFRKIAFLIT